MRLSGEWRLTAGESEIGREGPAEAGRHTMVRLKPDATYVLAQGALHPAATEVVGHGQ